MGTAQIIKVAKVTCPRCGSQFSIELTPEILAEVESNPLGLAGVALPHGDHVLVVYFDRNGGERGVRVFSLLQKQEKGFYEVKMERESLKGMRNISGFLIELRKLNLRLIYLQESTPITVRLSGRDIGLELTFQKDFSYQKVRGWLELLLDVFEGSYSASPSDYVNTLRILDVMLEENPFAYAKQVFWLVSNASTITIKSRLPESHLLKKYRPTILYEKYNGLFITRVVDSNGIKVSELLTETNPQILFSYSEAILSLYRRGVVDLVIE
ncbi:MAG: hypothetical protein ABWK01_09105 [Infirmifilum sp.]